MKVRYRLIYRGERSRTFYCVDSKTKQRTSLQTKDRDAAEQIVLAKNQALRQPQLNLQIARAYLAGTDSGVATCTWQNAVATLIETKHGATQERWVRAAKDKALDDIRNRVVATDGTKKLYLIEPDPAGFKSLASAELMDSGNNWAPLALSDGKLLIRDQKKLIVVQVAQ